MGTQIHTKKIWRPIRKNILRLVLEVRENVATGRWNRTDISLSEQFFKTSFGVCYVLTQSKSKPTTPNRAEYRQKSYERTSFYRILCIPWFILYTKNTEDKFSGMKLILWKHTLICTLQLF